MGGPTGKDIRDGSLWLHKLPPRQGGCYRGKLEAERDAYVGLGQVGLGVGNLRRDGEVGGGIDEPAVSCLHAETVGEFVRDSAAIKQDGAILADRGSGGTGDGGRKEQGAGAGFEERAESSVAIHTEREDVGERGFLNARLRDRAGIIDLRKKRIAVVGLECAPAIEMIPIVHQEPAGIGGGVNHTETIRLLLKVSGKVRGHF
jgi:hypothetical protein